MEAMADLVAALEEIGRKYNATPSPRDAYVMFFDPTRHSFIIYGGMDTQRYSLDDMWEYTPPEPGS